MLSARRRVLAVLVAAGLLLTACAGDDDADSSGTQDTSDDSGGDDTSGDSAGDDAAGDDGGDMGDDMGDDMATGDMGALCDVGNVVIVHLTDIVGESDTAIDDFWNGSSLAAAEVNEACGSEVVTLERIPTDFSVEGMEPKLLEAQEMSPTAIIGQGSSSQITLNGVVDEGGIPMLWPVGTGTGLVDAENGSDWAWMVRVVNDTQGLVWGTHLVESGAERVWLECVQTQLGVSGCGEATPILEEGGVEIVGRNDSGPGESDFTQSITDLQTADADAVLLAQFPRPHIAFSQQMEDNGALENTVIFGSTSTEVIYQALSAAQQDATIALADCNPREDDPDVNDAYRAEYDADMTSLAAVTYDSVYLVLDAAARQGGTSPDDIAAGLSSTSWEGVCQDYFDNGSHALAHRMVVTSFGGGQITTEAEYRLSDRGDALAE